MKDFTHWGVKVRVYPEKNYRAIWSNLKTTRIGVGSNEPLDPDRSEFYDIGINTKCNAECPFCYVSANKNGVNFPNIVNTWNKWIKTFPEDVQLSNGIIRTEKPFQVAIGSTGEPTIHPQFEAFLEAIYNSGVVPNYTTNGLTLGGKAWISVRDILEYTRKYVGGVAVSFGNPDLRDSAERAVDRLVAYGETKVNIHHIISDKDSVDNMVHFWKLYGNYIHYHILLPLMQSGRSSSGLKEGVWEYLEQQIAENGIDNAAFGAHFESQLRKSSMKTWLYPAESLSKNIILTENCVKITPSSFDLNPVKIINL